MSDTPSWLPANAESNRVRPEPVKRKAKPTPETKEAYPWHGAVKEPPAPETAAIVERTLAASMAGTLEPVPQSAFCHHKDLTAYTGQQLIDRERFVSEYLFDFSPRRAALRCGYSEKSASAVAHNFMAEPGVQRLIREHMQSYDVSALTKNRVIAGLIKEATNESSSASHAARIAAWKILGQAVGLGENEVKDDRPRGGVMVIPTTPVEAEWEAVASKSQEDLRNSVRD